MKNVILQCILMTVIIKAQFVSVGPLICRVIIVEYGEKLRLDPDSKITHRYLYLLNKSYVNFNDFVSE